MRELARARSGASRPASRPTRRRSASAASRSTASRPSTHRAPMLSLDNAYCGRRAARLRRARAQRPGTRRGAESTTSPSSRSTASASRSTYEDGVLVRGATRGDGERGEDVTAERAHDPRDSAEALTGGARRALEVRGEVYLPRAAFERINQRARRGGRAAVRQPAQRRGRHDAATSIPRWSPGAGCAAWVYQPSGRRCGRVARRDARSELRRLGAAGREALDALRRHRRASIAFCAAWRDERHALEFETDGVVIKVDALARARAARRHVEVSALGHRLQVPGRAGRRRRLKDIEVQRRAHRRRDAVRRARAGPAGRLDHHDGDAAQRRRGRAQGRPRSATAS